jgi:hypothetical protein
MKAAGNGMAPVSYSISRLARSTRDILELGSPPAGGPADRKDIGVSTAQWRQVDLQMQLQTTRLDAEGADRRCFGIEQSIFAAPHTPRIRLLSNIEVTPVWEPAVGRRQSPQWRTSMRSLATTKQNPRSHLLSRRWPRLPQFRSSCKANPNEDSWIPNRSEDRRHLCDE